MIKKSFNKRSKFCSSKPQSGSYNTNSKKLQSNFSYYNSNFAKRSLKGDLSIWVLLYALVTVVVVSVLIITLSKPASEIMDSAVKMQARYVGQEISGVVNMMNSGPDGFAYEYDLPRWSCPEHGCLRFYDNMVKIDFRSGNKYDSYFIEKTQDGTTYDGPIDVKNSDGFDNSENVARIGRGGVLWEDAKKIKFYKTNGKIVVKKAE